MAIELPKGLVELVGQLYDGFRTGFQRSHVIGRFFAEDNMQWLRRIDFDWNANYNLKPRPETLRGSATIGVAAHNGPHVAEIDALKYDIADDEGVSRKFANIIERKQQRELLEAAQRNATSSEIESIKTKYRVEMLNAVDFWSTLDLHQDHLDKMGFGDLRSVAFNGADPRTLGDLDALRTYLNQGQVSRQFDYDFMKAHPLFQDYETMRGGADIDIDRQIIAKYSIQGYIRYPEGEVIWTKDMQAESAVRKSIWANFAEPDGRMLPAQFEKFEAETRTQRFKNVVTKAQSWIGNIVADERGVLTFDLNKLEHDFMRTHRSSATKMREFADYSETRARMVIGLAQANWDRVPDFAKAGLKKAIDYYRKPDGTISKGRVGIGIAAGVLAVSNVWIELDKRNYDPAATALYLKEAAKDAVESLPYAAGIMLAAASPIGPLVMFTLGAVATYSAIRNLASYLTQKYAPAVGEAPSATYLFIKNIDDSLTKFEKDVKSYIDMASKALKTLAETSLEKVTGRSIEWLSEEASGWVGDDNDILIGDDVSILVGSDANNWLVHRSAGEVYGEAGDDTLIGWLPEEIKKGEAISGVWAAGADGQPVYKTAREIRAEEKAAIEQYQKGIRSGLPPEQNPAPTPTSNIERALKDHTLTLDGGQGNDWVLAIGGQQAKTIGGDGRDWVYNTSAGGELYGDTIDGLDSLGRVVYEEKWPGKAAAGQSGGAKRPTDPTKIEKHYYRYEENPAYNPETDPPEQKYIRKEDQKAKNAQADIFWYAAETTIMDGVRARSSGGWPSAVAQVDRLKFFGIPLTGGDAGATSLGFALGAFSGSIDVLGAALGGVALGTAGIDILRRGKGQGGLYYDTFLPNIIYTTQKNADGGVDLLVYNALSPLANLLFGDNSAFTQKKYDPVTGEEIPNAPPLSLRKTGVQTIKNFDMANASTQAVQGSGITNSLFSGFNAAFLAGHGDLNMVFRDRSALAVIALLQNAVKGVPIVQSLFAAYNALALAANDNEPCALPERAFCINKTA